MNYMKPSMEVIELRITDVITASDGTTDGGVHEEGTGGGVDF